MDLAGQKSRWRKNILALRAAQGPAAIEAKSGLIIESLEKTFLYRQVELVLFYASFRHEVFTHGAIKQALANGKRVALPRINGSELRLALVEDFQKDLAPNARGILEPKPERARWISPEKFSLAVVPGVAFDLENFRLGYGKGYYDRLLAQMPQAYKIGLAYELQVVPRLPRTPQDVGVDCVITETRTIAREK